MPKKRTVIKFYSAKQQRLASHAAALARQGAHHVPEVEAQRQESINAVHEAIEHDRAARMQAHIDNGGRKVGSLDPNNPDTRKPRAGDEGFKKQPRPPGARSRAKAAAKKRRNEKRGAIARAAQAQPKTAKAIKKEQRRERARTQNRYGDQSIRRNSGNPKSHASFGA